MTRFIIYFLSLIAFGIISLEIVIRIFSLAGHTIPMVNIEGNYLISPNEEGYFIRGGLSEIRSHYKANSQGWNSLKDYSILPKDKIKVAVVGDSYIEGFHTNVENSIGRILEHQDNDIVCHEYGIAGGNIVDFSLVYQDYLKGIYDFIFILVTDKDLTSKTPSFMNMGKKVPNDNIVRLIYNRLYFVRYLNINHSFSVKLQRLFEEGPSSIERIHAKQINTNVENDFLIKINKGALEKIGRNVVYIYEDSKLDTVFINWTNNTCLKIKHSIYPINHGFDTHWNYNGRLNCAITLKRYIDSNPL